jgi:LysM repeat protein
MHKRQSAVHQGLCTLVLFFMLFLALFPGGNVRAAGVWGRRPLLSYFGLTASLEAPLRYGARLSAADIQVVQAAALEEAQALHELFAQSERLIGDPGLTLAQKRGLIQRMGYNQRVARTVYRSDQRLRAALSPSAYRRLVNWIERRWGDEARLHGLAAAVEHSPLAAGRTYQIFATRFESKGGAYTAALPDQCLKFSNGGLKTCEDKGYTPGRGYAVALSYKKAAGVVVGEAGPWNVDDNYWATLGDPTPRRMFVDLPLGMPEAQAAYFNGYNGGLDQYGRTVTAPFGIDLAFQVADDLGLPPKKNDWITVTFLWTSDWDAPAAPPAPKPAQPTAPGSASSPPPGSPPAPPVGSIKTAAPAADGSIVHTVQAGETLWSVAVAYQVSVAQLQYLNNMGATIVIYEGQKLVIKEAGPAWTPRPGTETPATESPTAPAVTPQRAATTAAPPRPTHTAARASPPAAATAALAAQDGSHRAPPSGLAEGGLLIGALALALGGGLLFGAGWWLSRRRGEADAPPER